MIHITPRTASSVTIDVNGLTAILARARASERHPFQYILNPENPAHYAGIREALLSKYGTFDGVWQACDWS